jgi:hypothetical protein
LPSRSAKSLSTSWSNSHTGSAGMPVCFWIRAQIRTACNEVVPKS